MGKKVLFLTHHTAAAENPNGYRAGQYFPYLEERGFGVSTVTSRTPLAALIRACRQSDVVYVQRLLLNPLKRHLLRRFSKRVVFDFDDAIMYGRRGSPTRRRRFAGMVRISDMVFCGNAFLVSEAQKHKTENIMYVPTVVDTGEYPIKEHTRADPFIAGWMGTSSTLKYLGDIEPLFSSASASLSFKVVADKPPRIAGEWITFERWSAEAEKAQLLSFDMGLMPVRDDLWSKGKCGAKLIQYAASGLPALSHPRGVSKEIIEEGESGFLREDVAGWIDALDRLRMDLELRKRMGRKARSLAEEKYSVKVWGPRVAAMMDGL